jgi:hypothetical protein
MQIEETHPNGAKIKVSGWRAHKVVEAWRASQEPKDEKQEPVVGFMPNDSKLRTN